VRSSTCPQPAHISEAQLKANRENGTYCTGRAKSDAERALATSIVDDHWRPNRARAIEENIFDPG
jgi:hypothetical protein